MKSIAIKVSLICFFLCIFHSAAFSWIYVDNTNAPLVPLEGMYNITNDLDFKLTRNFRNYAAAFVMSNVAGYPIGDAYIGKFPSMFFGVSGTVGLANMKYFDEDRPREQSVYPAFAPNADILIGFGMGGGFDMMFKIMVFSDTMWRPPLNTKSAKLSKFNIYSGGFKLRKNLIERKVILPRVFNFGGFTISAGADYMEGIFAINGQYKYIMSNIFVNPPGNLLNLTFDAVYNFNLKWMMLSASAQAIVYFELFWLFDLYTGVGMALTHGYTKLDGSGVGTLTYQTSGDLGMIFARANYHYRARPFTGLFIVGLEINLWLLKVNIENMINISNGKDMSLQVGSRIQW